MPVLVHLAPEKYAKSIQRSGLKGKNGVYCMPVLQDYYVSHQWVRELKRDGQRAMVGVYFRLASTEPVSVGHYNTEHVQMSVGKAIQTIMNVTDPQGYELIIPRSIDAREIHSIRPVSGAIGWRYCPGVRARAWCNCPACVSQGEINSSKKREPREKPASYHDMLSALRTLAAKSYTGSDKQEDDDFEIMWLLGQIWYQKAGSASDFAFLLEYSSSDVIESLQDLLRTYKGKDARDMLRALEDKTT